MRSPPIDRDDVCVPGSEAQMGAAVAGCAMVSQADGWVTTDEPERMVDPMRNSPTVASFGADDAVVLFEALNRRFDCDSKAGAATAKIAVSRLRGQPGPSRALIETTCAVAQSDGDFAGGERAVILRPPGSRGPMSPLTPMSVPHTK